MEKAAVIWLLWILKMARVAVFEAKYSKMFQQLESDCNKAINQIESRMYAREFEENGDDVFCYGIAFFKKRC